MSDQVIPLFRPSTGMSEAEAIQRSLELGWLGMGAYVGQFEEGLKAYCGAPDRHFVAVSTGHAALHLALLVAGVKHGDEVIVPALVSSGDFQAVLAVGARPVFCDVDAWSLCIDPLKIEDAISPTTRAIIATDYDNGLCNHDSVSQLADKHGLRVVHDATHSFGGECAGKKIGSFSDIAILNFGPEQPLTAIDGGAIVVRSEKEKAQLHELRLIGMTQPSSVMYANSRAWTYDIANLGFRYHLANPHAAMGLAQLDKFDAAIVVRREACLYYNAQLAGIAGLETPQTELDGIVPLLYNVGVAEERRDDLRHHLWQRGIETGADWCAAHHLSIMQDGMPRSVPVAETAATQIVSLPLHNEMTREVQDAVIAAVRSFGAWQ